MNNTDEQQRLLVHAYLDGELDAFNSAAVSKTIAEDPLLRAEVARIEALRGAIHDKLKREPLPDHFRTKIDALIGSGTKTTGRPSWRTLAASVACAMIVASASTWFTLQPAIADRTLEAIADNHMRAVLSGQNTTVSSSDRHTVRPWFNGRIPQSPQVIDLSQDGFALVGGRIDVVNAAPVSTLVYTRRLHVISLAAVPLTGNRSDVSLRSTIKGFNLVGWSDGENQYWATSDLNTTELMQFAKSFEAALPKRAN